jgi:fatty acid desaturase
MIRILEIAWLIIAIGTAVIAVYQFIAEGWQSAIWMLMVTLVSMVMYTIRHRQRIRFEKHDQDEAKYH